MMPRQETGASWLRRDGLPKTRVFLLLLTVGLLAGFGLRDPWPPDEPRFAIIGLEFLRTTDWLFPHIAGVLYPDKPPIFLWLEAGAEWLVGSTRWAFLLPSLLAALATLLMTWDLGRRLWSPRAGYTAAFALLITLQFVLQARQAQIDMTLTAFTTLGLYGLARHLLAGPACGWYLAGYGGMALGILTKGVGFLPLLALVPWALAYRFANRGSMTRFHGLQPCLLTGIPVLLAILALWLVPMLYFAAGDEALAGYRDAILFHHTLERYANGWDHLKPWWYYLVNVIPLYWLPLSALLPWLVPAFWTRVRRGDARYWVLLGWIVLVVIFFSLADGKRNVYLLPAVPALALACGPLLSALLRRTGVQRTGTALTASVAALAGLGLVWGYLVDTGEAARLDARYGITLWPFLVVPLALAVAWTGFGLLKPRVGLYAFVGLTFSLWGVIGLGAYPVVNPVMSGHAFIDLVEERLPEEAELGIAGWSERYLLYFDGPVTHFGYRRPDGKREAIEAMEWVLGGPNRRLLVPEEHTRACVVSRHAIPAGFHSDSQWWLISGASLRDECVAKLLKLPPPHHIVTTPPPLTEGYHSGS